MYTIDLQSAARRHLRAGQLLDETAIAGTQPGCRAVAGYLFGLAGELALKQLMRQLLGLKQDLNNKKDPYYTHFPELRSMLLDMATSQGRRAAELRPILENPKLFQQWNIRMRYAPHREIQSEWVSNWRSAAERLVDKMGAL